MKNERNRHENRRERVSEDNEEDLKVKSLSLIETEDGRFQIFEIRSLVRYSGLANSTCSQMPVSLASTNIQRKLNNGASVGESPSPIHLLWNTAETNVPVLSEAIFSSGRTLS